MIERACQSVGIDLGTTYSSLAYMDAHMTPRVVADGSGQTVVPSVIFFDDDNVIVGDIALENARVRADRVVQFVKNHMGEEWRRDIGGQVHTPESLSAIILAHLVREAEPQVGPVPSAVITVPAYFTERRRRATQQAGEIAGLKVIGTLNEPMAAALAYGLYREDREQVAVVYDLGGGTFDVTVVRISPNTLEELATLGNPRLGGKDWDQCLIQHVAAEFRRRCGEDPTASAQAMQDLQLLCERAKRQLTRMARTKLVFSASGRSLELEVTRDQFEEMTAHLLKMTKLTLGMVVEDAGLGWDRVDRVVLVGGSTHMPMVRRMLEEVSGSPPDTGVNPVIAVALGAATYAHMLETGWAPKAIRQMSPRDQAGRPADGAASPPPAPAAVAGSGPPSVRFVTAHGVGVRLLHRQLGAINQVVIPRNHAVPARQTRRFLTQADKGRSQRLKVVITQGDSPDAELVEVLGTLYIEGLPPDEPGGQPVEVTLAFDPQGRLHIEALYLNTGQSLTHSLEIPGCLREEQVRMYREFLQESGLIRKPDTARSLGSIALLDDDDVPYLEPL